MQRTRMKLIPLKLIVVLLFVVLGCNYRSVTPATPCTNFQAKHNLENRFDIIIQPVHDYDISFDEITLKDGRVDLNPMRFYTRIGTNYGKMGTEKRHMKWLPTGQIQVEIHNDQWSGIWHSLHGLTQEKLPGLCFGAAYPKQILPGYQPKVIGAYITVKGKGRLKLEIKYRNVGGSEIREPYRLAKVVLDSEDEFHTLVWPHFEKKRNSLITFRNKSEVLGSNLLRWDCTAIASFPPISIFNWVAEGRGTSLIVDEIGLIFAYPNLLFEKRIFLKSLAKLALCYDEELGLVRDRANFPPGDMDSIPASGMFCLALAAAQSEGVVSKNEAIRILRKTQETINDGKIMPRAKGLLPHFVRWKKDHYVILDGSEFSAVDTAIYYHAMLLAAEILEQEDITENLTKEIRRIDFGFLTSGEGQPDSAGYISMGIRSDGKTLLGDENEPKKLFVWDSWGGEGALVLCLKKMAGGKRPFYLSRDCVTESPKELQIEGCTGRVYQGRGFIAEIQSLFYPQFDSEDADDITDMNWLKARQDMLGEQIKTTKEHFRESEAAKHGLYGYSSGESEKPVKWNEEGRPDYYLENGTRRRVGDNLIEPMGILLPHYILMSSHTPKNLDGPIKKLKFLEERGLFPPYGLVESFDVNLKKSLAMIGSLNASFEVISAFHLLCEVEGKSDVIYEAAKNSTVLSEAVSIFYLNSN